MSAFTVACIQNCAGNDLQHNLARCSELLRGAAARGARLLCLPEVFSIIAENDRRMLDAARPEAGHPAIEHMQALARELDAWLLLGSILIPDGAGKTFNRSFLIDPAGRVGARYDKLHLFDVQLSNGEAYRESGFAAAGDRAVTCDLPWGVLGLSVCYDLRFPQLYRALSQAGADFLAVPAAFTRTTGAAHWHTLVRARAIENGCFVFAPNQCGTRPWGRATWGHSLIVDPWGKVLAEGGENEGFITARIDPSLVRSARERIPALTHDRHFDVVHGPDSEPGVAAGASAVGHSR